MIEKPKDYVLVAGEPMTVETPDPQTVVFKLPAPKPGLLAHFATHFGPGFQPKHFLGQFHPAINPDADKLRAVAGLRERLQGDRRLLRQLGLDGHGDADAEQP